MRPWAVLLLGCAADTCPPLPSQWEQTGYSVEASATSPSGIAVDLSRVDAVADSVDACLASVDRAAISGAADCDVSATWRVDRDCTTVVLVPGEPSCTRPGTWLLPDRASPSACGGKTSAAPDGTDCSGSPCRWAVATQDGGRTIALPVDPATGAWSESRLAEGLVRVATSCRYPWSDPHLAGCSADGEM
jgi:hypothetical protein